MFDVRLRNSLEDILYEVKEFAKHCYMEFQFLFL